MHKRKVKSLNTKDIFFFTFLPNMMFQIQLMLPTMIIKDAKLFLPRAEKKIKNRNISLKENANVAVTVKSI